MHMQFSAVLFDMDGTILDSAPDFIAVSQQLLQRHNLPPVANEKIVNVVSAGAAAMVKAAFNIDAQDPRFEALRLEFLALYLEHCAVYSKLYDGIDELLSTIETAGLTWGIVTNKPACFAEQIVRRLNLEARCSLLICPDHVVEPKPSPEALLLASAKLSIAPWEMIYVGDDKRDIEAGNAAGCKTIAVRYGYVHPQDNPHNWGAGAVVDTVSDLYQLIDRAICGC